ncbi:MAG: hypothetical protein VB122_01910 [Erysipelotrichales bacterium]|nr:hypothetical protein [Erysipelotrichales bacterium]
MKKLFLASSMIVLTFFSISSGMNYSSNATTISLDVSEESAIVNNKEEVIYANIDSFGNVNNIYAVNIFDVSKGGIISDYGNYSSLKNLTNSSEITYEDETIGVKSDVGTFYYQGNLISQNLPWDIVIKYHINGIEVTPEKLSGSSGHLLISLTSSKNQAVNSFFYDNYLMQISFNLNVNKATNVVANQGIIANSGKNKLVNCTVMPKTDANIKVEADVNNFSMDGIDIAAMPMSIDFDIPNISSISGEFDDLISAVSDFSSGINVMSDAANDMKQGLYELLNGSIDFSQGLNDISSNFATILSGSSSIKSGLDLLSSSVSGLGSMVDFSSIESLPAGLTSISSGLTSMSSGLDTLKSNFNSAYGALDTSINSIPECDILPSEIQSLRDNNPSSTELIDKLSSFYSSACAVKVTYENVEPAFEAIDTGLSGVITNLGTIITSLDNMASGIESSFGDEDYGLMLSTLENSITAIATNYNSFHQGLSAYYAGLNLLVNGYTDFNSGLRELYLGDVEFYNGMVELSEGALQLLEGVQEIPQQLQEKIDELISQYNKKDLEYISFVNQENENIKSVQFVIKGSSIEEKVIDIPDDGDQNNNVEETFWTRLINLFRKNS